MATSRTKSSGAINKKQFEILNICEHPWEQEHRNQLQSTAILQKEEYELKIRGNSIFPVNGNRLEKAL